jgi:hypothetical protein
MVWLTHRPARSSTHGAPSATPPIDPYGSGAQLRAWPAESQKGTDLLATRLSAENGPQGRKWSNPIDNPPTKHIETGSAQESFDLRPCVETVPAVAYGKYEAPRGNGKHVRQYEDSVAREHPGRLPEPLGLITPVMEGDSAEHHVKTAVRERQTLSRGLEDMEARVRQGRFLSHSDHLGRRIYTIEFTHGKALRRFTQKSTCSAADVKKTKPLRPQSRNNIEDGTLHPPEEDPLQAALVIVGRPVVEASHILLAHGGNAITGSWDLDAEERDHRSTAVSFRTSHLLESEQWPFEI